MPPETIRDKAAKWLFSQGVSTILLFGIFALVYYQHPLIIGAIQHGYVDNAKDLKDSAEMFMTASQIHRDTTENLVERLEREYRHQQKLVFELLSCGDINAADLKKALEVSDEEGN